MSKSSDLGWWTCEGWQPCNCLRMPEARRFQESRMPGNPLVRFDEGRVGRTRKVSPSLLLYWPDFLGLHPCVGYRRRRIWLSPISSKPLPRKTRVAGSGVSATRKRCSAVLPLPGVPGFQILTLLKNELEICPLL